MSWGIDPPPAEMRNAYRQPHQHGAGAGGAWWVIGGLASMVGALVPALLAGVFGIFGLLEPSSSVEDGVHGPTEEGVVILVLIGAALLTAASAMFIGGAIAIARGASGRWPTTPWPWLLIAVAPAGWLIFAAAWHL